MMNKGILYKILIIPLLLIPLVCPFHISAGTVYGDSPIIGVNVYVVDREYARYATSATVSLETDQTRWVCQAGSSTGCTAWRSLDYQDNVLNDITGTITYTSGSSNVYYYELDFVFDKEYVGWVRFSSQITAGSGNMYYVNGDHLIITTSTLVNEFTVTEYSLSAKNDSSFQWMFPLESYGFIAPMMYRNYEIVDINQYGNYYIPTIRLQKDNILLETYLGADENNMAYVIFISKKNYPSTTEFFNDFDVGNLTVNGIGTLQLLGSYRLYGRVYKVQFFNNTGTANYFTIKAKQTVEFMPIYYNRKIDEPYGYANVGTDFALTFKIQNELLYNLNIIANGTNNSNSDASNLETVSDDISSSSDDLIQSENSFNNSMNSNLQRIDTNINIGNLGNKFLASAEWVRVQFNTLTNGTPFGSVLSFSLLFGLALVLVGRIRK